MSKPAFDPSKPFEVAPGGEKPPFDPSKPFEVGEENRLSLEEPSLLSKAGDVVARFGQAVDSYTGAPTRAAIGAMQDGRSPLSAFTSQWGESPSKAPSGPEIMVKAGVDNQPIVISADQQRKFDQMNNPGLYASLNKAGVEYQDKELPSKASALGTLVNLGADWTNAIPAVGMLKNVGRGAKAGAEVALDATKALAKTTRAGEAIVDTAKATKDALANVFKPTQAKDFGEFVEIAQKNGIDPSLLPESVEFGPGSVISRGARTVREGPIGEADMAKFETGLNAVSDAIDNHVSKISGGMPLNPIEAGEAIRAGYNKRVDDLFNTVDVTYSRVIDMLPGARLTPESAESVASKLNSIEKWAKGRVMRGFTKTDRTQGEQVLAAINAVRAGNGSLKQTYEAMTDIGRVAFKQAKTAASDVPPDVEKFRDLYFKLREEFINTTARLGGPDMADDLINSNQLITMFHQDKAPIAKLLANKEIAPEKLFKSLIVNGDSKRIVALKEILSPEEFNQLRGSYLESIIQRDSYGRVNFGALRTALQRNQSIVSSLFTPEEITDLGQVVKLGERFGPAVLSTSGTGGSGLYRNMLEGIKSGATNRTTLEYMKDAARGRSAKVAEKAAREAPKSAPSSQLDSFRRTSGEEALKYSQIYGSQETAREKEKNSAILRKLQNMRGQ